MNTETKSEELSKAHDQLCQEIGRNLLRFQLLELLLKDLVSKSKIEVTLDSIKQPRTDRQTLGGISTHFFEEVVSELDPIQATDESNHLKSEFNFRIPLNEGAKAEWMDRVRKLIKERNDLIHTSLKTMILKSVESCQKETDSLVLQRSRIQLKNSDISFDNLLRLFTAAFSQSISSDLPEKKKIQKATTPTTESLQKKLSLTQSLGNLFEASTKIKNKKD